MDIITSAVSQGIIWSVMVLGVYISYRILDFADLTADGTIALGGSVAAVCIVNGINPYLALIISTIFGALAGMVTGILNAKFEIPGILAGILTMISLYSINIEILGRANISLLGETTCFSVVENKIGLSYIYSCVLVSLIVCIIVIAALKWFISTEIGQLIRATGDNQNMVCAMGKDPKVFKIAALSISNGLIALSGGLIAQNQGYADVTMGTGAIIIGLASIIIGEVIFGKRLGFVYKFASVVLGSIIYRLIIAAVLYIGLKPTMLNLLTALVVATALSLPAVRKNIKFKGADKKCSKSMVYTKHSTEALKMKS